MTLTENTQSNHAYRIHSKTVSHQTSNVTHCAHQHTNILNGKIHSEHKPDTTKQIVLSRHSLLAETAYLDLNDHAFAIHNSSQLSGLRGCNTFVWLFGCSRRGRNSSLFRSKSGYGHSFVCSSFDRFLTDNDLPVVLSFLWTNQTKHVLAITHRLPNTYRHIASDQYNSTTAQQRNSTTASE